MLSQTSPPRALSHSSFGGRLEELPPYFEAKGCAETAAWLGLQLALCLCQATRARVVPHARASLAPTLLLPRSSLRTLLLCRGRRSHERRAQRMKSERERGGQHLASGPSRQQARARERGRKCSRASYNTPAPLRTTPRPRRGPRLGARAAPRRSLAAAQPWITLGLLATPPKSGRTFLPPLWPCRRPSAPCTGSLTSCLRCC